MVANDVEMIQESMLNQLLKELNGNVQLPGCIKIISYLRRMNKFTESELRIKFLIVSFQVNFKYFYLNIQI